MTKRRILFKRKIPHILGENGSHHQLSERARELRADMQREARVKQDEGRNSRSRTERE